MSKSGKTYGNSTGSGFIDQLEVTVSEYTQIIASIKGRNPESVPRLKFVSKTRRLAQLPSKT